MIVYLMISPDENSLYNNEFKYYIDSQVMDMEISFDKNVACANIVSKFSTAEVMKVCKSMPNNKAPGYDLITYECFKFGGIKLYEVLTTLFNSIISEIHFPDSFKKGIIIPVYKGKRKAKDDVNSYRGITLMPVINKLLEKRIWERLSPWLAENNFPHPLQHACRKGSSAVPFCHFSRMK